MGCARFVPTLGLFLLAACGPDPEAHREQVERAIEARESELIAAIHAKDAARAANIYASAAVIESPNEQLRIGTDIKLGYEALFADPQSELEFTVPFRVMQTATSGDLAYTWSDCRERSSDPAGAGTRMWDGVCLKIWAIAEGRWVIKIEARNPTGPVQHRP